MIEYLNKSILRKLMFSMTIFIIVSVIISAILYGYSQNLETSYETQIEELKHKERILERLENNILLMVVEARGYFLFKQEQDLNNIYVARAQIEEELGAFQQLELNNEEKLLVDHVHVYLDRFHDDILPLAFEYVEADDYISLQTLARFGGTEVTKTALNQINHVQTDLEKQIIENERAFLEQLHNNTIMFILFIIIIMLFVTLVVFNIVKEIGKPLRELAKASKRLAKGEDVKLPDNSREDEFGSLTRSFNHMVKSIQDNEQQLVAQNEELMAQQSELEEAFEQMDLSKSLLERRNYLSHSLANTLDKQLLLNSIIESVVELMNADKGIIVLLNEEKDLASIGISKEGEQQFLSSLSDGFIERILNSNKPYTLTRKALAQECGYHESVFNRQDLYVPIVSHKKEVLAIIVLTRLGNSFTEKEQGEISSLVRQISPALDNIALYENSEDARKLNQDILNTVREGIQFVSKDGTILRVNRQWSKLFGFDNMHQMVETVKDDWLDQLKQSFVQSDQFIQFVNDVLNGDMENNEIILKMSGTNPVIMQLYYEILYRGKERVGTIFVYRDITKEYEVDKMKSEFVSTVSHELRTPLSSVLGFTELMLTKELKVERQKKYLSMIHKEAKRLTSLINDFLDVQRMESGKQVYEKKPIDLVPILNEVVDTFKVQSTQHTFYIKAKTDQTVINADDDKIKQVFTNLISNAVKYSPDGGDVTITLRSDDKSLYIDLTDQGLGIPEDAIALLFTKFYRIDNSERRKIGGTGLGLAICKEIVKAHEGNISVTSTSNKGSTFTVQFPLQNTESKVDFTTYEGITDTHKPTLFIVEDDESLSALLMEEFHESGFNVYQSKDGQDSINKIKKYLPDAVVLDIMLEGDLDGWHVIEELKKDRKTSQIPIFISTALDEKAKGISLGAKHYLTKPYQPSQLSKLILQTLLRQEKSGEIMIPTDEDEQSQTE